ncbi:hypothetical protein ACUIJ5_29205 (plasmid) [Bacillus toyonensis]
MEKFKNCFSLTTHPDERIQKIELSIWAQSGVFILLIALADVIMRGFFFTSSLYRMGYNTWDCCQFWCVFFNQMFVCRCV